MHHRLRIIFAVTALAAACCAGCFIPGWVAINVPPVANPTGDVVDESSRARLEHITGVR